jgi:hypothetical protein
MASTPSRLKSDLIGRQTAMDYNRLPLRHDPSRISQFGKTTHQSGISKL